MKPRKTLWLTIIILAGFSIAALYSCSDDDNETINDNLPVLTTTEVTNIKQTTATSGGNITDDGGATITARGVIWSTSANLTINDNEGITVDGAGAGSFTSNITGLEPETQYYVRAYATNSNGTGYGNALAFTTFEGTVTDIDNNLYQTVIIGNQEWMAENLRVTRYNNGDNISTGLSDAEWGSTTSGAYAIYNNDDDMLQAYGKLYNWYAVDDARGLCPEGWSVPSDADWTALVNYVVSGGFPNSNVTNGAGNALKSCRQVGHPDGGDCDTSEHPRWDSDGTYSGFDEFGFSALPGGSRFTNGSFASLGTHGDWWSSTGYSSTYAWNRSMSHGNGNVYRLIYNKSYGFSLRCFRDLD